MKKCYMLVAFLIILSAMVTAEAVKMPELLNPDSIAVDDKDIVVTDGINVLIFAQKNYKLRLKFGKQGAGPQEFAIAENPWLPSIRVYLKPDRIFVSSFGKLSFFDRNGVYINEFRTTTPESQYIPMQKKYVVLGLFEDNLRWVTYTLFDAAQKKEKELLRVKSLEQRGAKLNPVAIGMIKSFLYKQTDGNKIFLPGDDEAIHVFNESGIEISTIKPPYEKIDFTEANEKEFVQFFTNDIRFKEIYARDKSRMAYPDVYPPLKEYRVTNGKIYIITYKKVDGKYETLILDFKGKLLKKVLLPLVDASPLEVYPFAIHNNRVYQLIEDEDAEIWQLHVTEIK